ncbi:MAG: bifunctional folylpolyglutamate synthase/dihydrofolate synthase [Clostridiales bacterium]|nr:bifunctional folylpolyglutamate synthase/dihydrofolate synthase [Clostridiales bacterium]
MGDRGIKGAERAKFEYAAVLEAVRGLEKFGSRPGLDNIRAICTALGNPQEDLRFIHVAGTNGKGSTTQFISSILSAAGYKTGVYSSPSIRSYRERIQVDGENIPREAFAKLGGLILEEPQIAVTEFELTTAMSFLHFKRENCDYVVMETGLGGKEDATNVIPPPEVAALTPISIDHTRVLGSTIGEITAQKCGIVKDGCRTVSSAQTPEVREIITKLVQDVVFAPTVEILEMKQEGTRFKMGGETYEIRLLGAHQAENAATAITAAGCLNDARLTRDVIKAGVKKANIPYRFEVTRDKTLGRGKLLLRDGAHNPAGITALARAIRDYFPNRKIAVVMGCLADKDYASCVKILAPLTKSFIAVTPDSPRALDARKLASIAAEFCEETDVAPSVDAAIKKAAYGADIILVCGSFTMFI